MAKQVEKTAKEISATPSGEHKALAVLRRGIKGHQDLHDLVLAGLEDALSGGDLQEAATINTSCGRLIANANLEFRKAIFRRSMGGEKKAAVTGKNQEMLLGA
jgi:hypothetical protein